MLGFSLKKYLRRKVVIFSGNIRKKMPNLRRRYFGRLSFMNVHSAFYKFVAIDEPELLAQSLRAAAHSITGSIIVAHEGINGTVAGEAQEIAAFEAALRGDPRFPDIAFKHSGWVTPPFGRMKVGVRSRIVAIDLPEEVDSKLKTARTALTPQAWQDFIARKDVVVLDNRNHFEWALGRFSGALNPDVSLFKDFPSFVEANAANWKAEGKTVAMYCTGGIRCERTSGWVESLGLQCVELEGGILNYLEKIPQPNSAWEGECYVFDNRVALDHSLKETETTAAKVFAPFPEEAWRVARARTLEASARGDGEE
jgi:UPF0176 protein